MVENVRIMPRHFVAGILHFRCTHVNSQTHDGARLISQHGPVCRFNLGVLMRNVAMWKTLWISVIITLCQQVKEMTIGDVPNVNDGTGDQSAGASADIYRE